MADLKIGVAYWHILMQLPDKCMTQLWFKSQKGKRFLADQVLPRLNTTRNSWIFQQLEIKDLLYVYIPVANSRIFCGNKIFHNQLSSGAAKNQFKKFQGLQPPGGKGAGNSKLFRAGMLVLPLGGKNLMIWHHLGCQRQNFDICIQYGTFSKGFNPQYHS